MSRDTLKPAQDSFNISKLYMWRCIITMAHSDGLVHDEERKYLTHIFDNMRERAGLSQDNYILLISDLSAPQDCFEMLSHVNDPAYRAQVTYFARLLAYKDGNLDPNEADLLEKLHIKLTDGLNIEEIKSSITKEVTQDMTAHELAQDGRRPEGLLSTLIDNLFLHFGIDLMD